jgi:hypothetical protein
MKLSWVLYAPDAVDVVCCIALRCVHVREVCLCAVESVALRIGCTCGLLHSVDLRQQADPAACQVNVNEFKASYECLRHSFLFCDTHIWRAVQHHTTCGVAQRGVA